MEPGSRRSAPRTWPGARRGQRSRPSRAARCGGRSAARPRAAGSTIMASAGPGDEPRELLAAPWNARTRVHEYGGRSYLPVPSLSRPAGSTSSSRTSPTSGCTGCGRRGAAGTAADAADAGGRRVPVRRPGPVPRRPGDLVRAGDRARPDDGAAGARVPRRRRHEGEPGDRRGAARRVRGRRHGLGRHGPRRHGLRRCRWRWEGWRRHRGRGGRRRSIRVLVSGAQFFAFPTPSPDGSKLAWINWDHPRMPWDGTELRVGAVTAAAAASGSRTRRWSWAGPRSRCSPRVARRRDACT